MTFMHVLNRVDVVLLGLMMISILCVLVKIEYQQAPLLSVRALIISSAVGVVVLWSGELWARVAAPARAPQLPVDTGQDRMCGPCVM